MVFHQKYLQNGTSIHFHGIRNQGPADSDYVNVLKNVTARTNDFDTFVPKPENSLVNGMHPSNCAFSAEFGSQTHQSRDSHSNEAGHTDYDSST
ncbi:hypothetical protein E2P81_ATG07731 [Venturia nashicola]|nr:hypothetical protein E2P81_ATG07731 [Venturia nashicola]